MTGRSHLAPTRAELRSWLALAKRAAARGVEVLTTERAKGRRVVRSKSRDVKIVADAALDRAIIRLLRGESRFAILSEESGATDSGSPPDGYRWIVDPLDGSLNHSRQIPFCAVSVGLWHDETPVLGVIHDPFRREVFSGIVGIGAWLNGRSITTSTVRRRSEAVLCTGFPIATDFRVDALASFVHQIRTFKKVRLFGSAALSLAYVAGGRADAYVERDIKLWDVAAGVAVVRAAGGACVARPGRWALSRGISATNGRLRPFSPRATPNRHEYASPAR
jgi:myo-inositol-1(or 4)-monophosphatase